MPAEQMDGPTAEGYDRAAGTADRLKRALEAHGIVLPSLSARWPVNGTPMVELGGCRADVVEALAEVLERAQ
ncbi:hypothetical protein ACFWOJ_02875 [Streptomyces sp. NPDC058439]|uniref:hypothetical protein n=1 Tax=Streptomyces sp. NPDC058439 TaxID=3346500 RepID=UPI00364A7D9C